MITEYEQSILDRYYEDPVWPEPKEVSDIVEKIGQEKIDQIERMAKMAAPRPALRTDAHRPLEELLGPPTAEAFKQAAKHFKRVWRGVSFEDLEQELLLKAYELRTENAGYVYRSLRNAGFNWIKTELRNSGRYVAAGVYIDDDHLTSFNETVKERQQLKTEDLLEDQFIDVTCTRFNPDTQENPVFINNSEVLKAMMVSFANNPWSLTNENRIVIQEIWDEMPGDVRLSLMAYTRGNPSSTHKSKLTRYVRDIPIGRYQ